MSWESPGDEEDRICSSDEEKGTSASMCSFLKAAGVTKKAAPQKKIQRLLQSPSKSDKDQGLAVMVSTLILTPFGILKN